RAGAGQLGAHPGEPPGPRRVEAVPHRRLDARDADAHRLVALHEPEQPTGAEQVVDLPQRGDPGTDVVQHGRRPPDIRRPEARQGGASPPPTGPSSPPVRSGPVTGRSAAPSSPTWGSTGGAHTTAADPGAGRSSGTAARRVVTRSASPRSAMRARAAVSIASA